MEYSINLTAQAILQIQNTISYISNVLLAPETAIKWADYLEKEISKLSNMPSRFSKLEDEPWFSRGFRKMPIKNFIVYYYIDEINKIVWITAVIYGKRDQLNALKNTPLK